MKAFFQMVREEIEAESGRADVLTLTQFLAVLRLAFPSETPPHASDLESQFKVRTPLPHALAPFFLIDICRHFLCWQDLVDVIFAGDGYTRAEIVSRLTEISALHGITHLSKLEDPMRIEMTEEDGPLGEDEEQQQGASQTTWRRKGRPDNRRCH